MLAEEVKSSGVYVDEDLIRIWLGLWRVLGVLGRQLVYALHVFVDNVALHRVRSV